MTYKSKIQSKTVDELFEAVLKLETKEECYRFFEDMCTMTEIKSQAQRLQVAKLLRKKESYSEIVKETGASTTTITRISGAVDYGTGGYNLILDKLEGDSE